MDNGTSDSKGANFELLDELSTAKQNICDENPTYSENDTQEENENGLSEDALLAQMRYSKSDEEDEEEKDISEEEILAQMGYAKFDEEEEEEEERDFSEEEILAQMGYAEFDEEDEEEKDFSEEEILVQMGYAETQPKRKTLNDIIEAAFRAKMGCPNKEPPKHEPITTPTSELNLVSAFKGSRQKDGMSPKERRVSWDPDVYDPYPSYYEHLLPSKNEEDKDDVNSKNMQKGGGRKAGSGEGEEGEVTGERPSMKEVIQKLSEAIDISPEETTPSLSPLWWAELEVLPAT